MNILFLFCLGHRILSAHSVFNPNRSAVRWIKSKSDKKESRTIQNTSSDLPFVNLFYDRNQQRGNISGSDIMELDDLSAAQSDGYGSDGSIADRKNCLNSSSATETQLDPHEYALSTWTVCGFILFEICVVITYISVITILIHVLYP